MTTDPTSNRGATPSSNPSPESRLYAPAPLSRSRASSRSTVTLPTDAETPVVMVRMTQRTRERPIEDVGSDPGPSRRNPKRRRIPGREGDDDDDDDDEYLPRKRAMLSRPATRGVHAVRRLFVPVVAALNAHYPTGTVNVSCGH